MSPAAPFPSTRVWFIHDWLTGLRGGEKVLLELVRLFPNSRIATLLHLPGTTHPDIDARVARTSFLQKLPNAATAYRNYLPLFPKAIRSLQLDTDADLVISVSHAVSKGIRIPKKNGHQLPHLCFCNTPMRYIWGMEDHYLSKASPKRLALAAVKPMLQKFDLQNDSVTQFIANSQTVADRIQRIYNRDARVIHPGIDETFYTLPPTTQPRQDFYLVVSALVPYKRIDLAILACLTTDRKLIIIGTGPEEDRFKKLASLATGRGALNESSNPITFLGRASDEVVRDHYQRCRAFLFPGEEDFGLTPIEAQACGAPVLAYFAGGATETVIGKDIPPTQPTGNFFVRQSVESLTIALEELERNPTRFTPNAARTNALHFTWTHFREQMLDAVQKLLPISAN